MVYAFVGRFVRYLSRCPSKGTVLPVRLWVLLAMVSAMANAGDIFRYVEEDGTVVYTNVPNAAGKKRARKVEGDFRPAPSVTQPARITPSSKEALTSYDQLIEAAAIRYRLPPNLLRAVMHAESAFDPNAISPVGASGLMQLMPQTAREMFVNDIFEPAQNIEGGARYLRVLANEFDGDMVKMVAAYNAGPDAVKKYKGNVPPYAETQAYVRKVVALYFQYKAQREAASGAQKN
jgi:soluble lytic murein transglycosylase-like protein